MSGEQKGGSAKPGANPFFDESEEPRPLPRARRLKPPPGIISAGGVDMARAHASNIRVPGGGIPALLPDEPRVVVSVETDARKVPTHKRLLDGRDPDDDTRSALLPGTPGEATLNSRARAPSDQPPALAAPPRPAPAVARPRPAPEKMPAWMRVALPVVLLLLLLGIARRARLWLAAPEPAPPVAVLATPAPPPVVVEAPAVVRTVAPAPELTAEEPAPPASPRRVAPAPVASATVTAEAAPRVARPAPPPTARPENTPPFELPGEKTKE